MKDRPRWASRIDLGLFDCWRGCCRGLLRHPRRTTRMIRGQVEELDCRLEKLMAMLLVNMLDSLHEEREKDDE